AKTFNAAHIDNIISAEIPDKVTSPALFRVVSERMVHGPCGAQNIKSPCMEGGRCTKHYPKEFVEITTVDDEGYPIYRRRNNGHTFKKNECDIDNRYVVPYNRELLLHFNAHINVEWCNQAQTIKYMFKYINKGHDRVTTSIYTLLDEIKSYLNCRYISLHEAFWRLFCFAIHYRSIPVLMLCFHLLDEHDVLFHDNDPIDVVVQRPRVDDSMFLAWMKYNKNYEEARNLTYY
ncbi:hypothetical protein V2J09_010600, partial [Rumex salicifolius]